MQKRHRIATLYIQTYHSFQTLVASLIHSSNRTPQFTQQFLLSTMEESIQSDEIPKFRDIRRYYCQFCGICRSKKTLITSHINSEHKVLFLLKFNLRSIVLTKWATQFLQKMNKF